jgi:hypothetical protein
LQKDGHSQPDLCFDAELGMILSFEESLDLDQQIDPDEHHLL